MSELTKEQSIAAKAITNWVNSSSSPWIFSLAGYAGTGKTFLLQRLIEDLPHERLRCAAPTGKAASVLQSKLTGIVVQTLHQLLYTPNRDSIEVLEQLYAKLSEEDDEKKKEAIEEEIREEKAKLSAKKPTFNMKQNSDINETTIVIVDEASMASPKILRDLESTGCKALFVGDPGQLPPVGNVNWFLDRDHDAQLVSIQRQAKESPIIRLSFQIRNGDVNVKEFREGDCRIVKKGDVPLEEWEMVDQVLTGRNASRHKINRFMRKRMGFEGIDPRENEKLICLKNDNQQDPPFINGVIFNSLSDGELDEGGSYRIDIDYEGHELYGIEYYEHHTHANYRSNLEIEPVEFRRGLLELDYAYAITVHKSQGSEWDSVFVADDEMQIQDKDFRRKWLYTAVTRAKKKLTLIK